MQYNLYLYEKKVTGISFKRKIDRGIEKNSFIQNQIILQWVFFFLDLPDQMSLKQNIMIVFKSCIILVHTCMLQCKRNLNMLIFSIFTCCISLPIFINSGGRPIRVKHKISTKKIKPSHIPKPHGQYLFFRHIIFQVVTLHQLITIKK